MKCPERARAHKPAAPCWPCRSPYSRVMGEGDRVRLSNVLPRRTVNRNPSVSPLWMGRRETALALRLFALAVASACGSLLPAVAAHPNGFLLGILAGTAMALIQDRLFRSVPRV